MADHIPRARRAKRRLRLLNQLRHSGALLASLILLACSAFFFVKAEAHRTSLRPRSAEGVATPGPEELMTVVAVIDGDEVTVENVVGERFLVRILGVKSFEAHLNDPLVAQLGERSFEAIRRWLISRKVHLHFDADPAKKRDSRGRWLAYIETPEREGEAAVDVGLSLVEEGYVAVFTKYPFGRMPQYLEVEKTARREHKGIWSSAAARSRIDASRRANWHKNRGADPKSAEAKLP